MFMSVDQHFPLLHAMYPLCLHVVFPFSSSVNLVVCPAMYFFHPSYNEMKAAPTVCRKRQLFKASDGSEVSATFRNRSMANELQHNTCDEPRKMSYKLIKHITKDLDKERIVGSGGFGTVYRGVYENGEEIAVKILRNMFEFDSKEFRKELSNLQGLKHQNIVELVGFCEETEEVVADYKGKQVIATQIHTALCFEYVQNGSLQKHISDEYTGLNWLTRYKIIKGICQGLKYLREGLKSPVMHLDLKPDNILLDQAMVPKIADFGLARLFGEKNTIKTNTSVGTIGYLPPEYIELQVISQNFDIFSLGVIITKIITGDEGYKSIADMAPTKFVKQVHDKWRLRLLQILEPRPLEVYCHQIKRCIEIALECIKRNRRERPSIQCIVSILLETEMIIGDLGLEAEKFPDGKSIDTGKHRLKRQLAAITKENALFHERNIAERPPGIPTPTGDMIKSKLSNVSLLPGVLPLDFLKNITNDFSDERKLGVDAFGTVYMGTLPDGEVIAVKRLSDTSPLLCSRRFTNEIKNIITLYHQNIVKLVAYSHEETKKVVQIDGGYMFGDTLEFILCHEYLPQGSLQKNLFEVPCIMDWDTRFNIIKGICRGLHFLHVNSIIHMNLKPETIFLDDVMEPKIGSFGLSRLFGKEQTRVNTLNVVGANGYMPPEYMYIGEISAQSDIYSLGVVIIETTTGEKNIPKKNEPSAREFIGEVRQKWKREHMESVYKQLNSEQLLEVKVCIEIGLECVEIDRMRRPSMEYIIDCLSGRSPTTSASDSYLVLSQRKTLLVRPLQLRFLSEPKRLTTRFLYLTNSTNNCIAFRLLTETPRRYLTKLPLCGIVPPNCTYTLCVTMREHVKAPPSNSNQFLTLQTREVLSRDRKYVDNPDSLPEFLGKASDMVKEVEVMVICERPARRSIFKRKQKNQSVQREIEIIDGQNYRQVLSVDIHSMEPWILTSNQRGYACIWNYQTQAEVHCFEVSREEPVYSAKFIEREEWLVVGGGDGYIYVYRYDTMEEVTSVGAHDGRRPVTSLAVHPTHSLVLSASDDDLIKLWDWKNDWQCTRTFEWQNKIVTQVMFDPNDSNSFASTSLEGTVKIWNSSSGMCIITLGHPDGLHCLHYVTADNQRLLISGSSNGAATIWDLQTDRCVDTLEGHANHLNALWWHPELPVLITGSADGTVQIWKFTDNTYRLESIIGFNLGSVNALGYMKTLKRIVVGCEQGVAIMEINLP